MRLQQKNHANLVRQKLRMPAKSKSQQKLFALVHLYQQGKIPADKVSNTIKRIAKTISPEDAKKYASTPHANLKNVVESFAYIHETVNEIVQYKKADYIRGQLVDQYTANLIKTVLNNLHEDNQKIFLAKSVDEMVAIAYKMVTE